MEQDKEKLNDLFSRIRNFDFPVCESENAKCVVSEIKEGFEIILKGMKDAAKNIKDNEK